MELQSAEDTPVVQQWVKPLLNTLSTQPHLLIVGQAGSGKSTVLRALNRASGGKLRTLPLPLPPHPDEADVIWVADPLSAFPVDELGTWLRDHPQTRVIGVMRPQDVPVREFDEVWRIPTPTPEELHVILSKRFPTSYASHTHAEVDEFLGILAQGLPGFAEPARSLAAWEDVHRVRPNPLPFIEQTRVHVSDLSRPHDPMDPAVRIRHARDLRQKLRRLLKGHSELRKTLRALLLPYLLDPSIQAPMIRLVDEDGERAPQLLHVLSELFPDMNLSADPHDLIRAPPSTLRIWVSKDVGGDDGPFVSLHLPPPVISPVDQIEDELRAQFMFPRWKPGERALFVRDMWGEDEHKIREELEKRAVFIALERLGIPEGKSTVNIWESEE